MARARAAVAARASGQSAVLVEAPGPARLPALPTARSLAQVAPVVRIPGQAAQVSPPTPSWPSCEAVAASANLSRGAARVWGLLHRLAVHAALARAYAVLPAQIVVHLPAELLALGVGFSRRHLYRLLNELANADLVAHGGHAVKVKDMGLYDGCLWAVKVAPDGPAPRLRREDWKASYRDAAADWAAGRTVKALVESMSHLQADQAKEGYVEALKTWAVAPGQLKNPVLDVGVTSGGADLAGVQDVVYTLGALAHVHPTRRPELIGRMASALAHDLEGDTHSRRWYCRLIWSALEADLEGRGGLQALAAALARLDADRKEWAGLRSPGALLAARLKAA